MSVRDAGAIREIEAQREAMASRAAEFAGELALVKQELNAATDLIVTLELKIDQLTGVGEVVLLRFKDGHLSGY